MPAQRELQQRKAIRTASVQRSHQSALGLTATGASKRSITFEHREVEETVKKAVRRHHTTAAGEALRRWANPAALGTAIWERILRQLGDAQITRNLLDRRHFSHLLPDNDNCTPRQRDIFDALLHRPMTVTNAELAEAIALKLDDYTVEHPGQGVHCYVRSWALTAPELGAVIDKMSTAFEETLEWKRVLDLFAPETRTADDDLEYQSVVDKEIFSSYPRSLTDASTSATASELKNNIDNLVKRPRTKDQIFTIRYVGTCAFPSRPRDRLLGDMENKKAGVMVDFMQVLAQLFPHVLDAAQVHTIATRDLDTDLGAHRTNQDLMERVHIEYFDHTTLLNRQHGGYWADYIPLEEDVDAFKALERQFYFKLHNNSSITPTSMQSAIVQHYEAVQEFVEGDAGTGSGRYPFTNNFRDLTAQQAQPALYKGRVVILVLIGKDVTLDNFMREVGFFNGRSQAAMLVRDFLVKFAGLEGTYSGATNNVNISQIFNTGLFPFVDLWNWIWHTQSEEAVAYLRRYLNIAKPLMAVSMGRDVNDISQASFQHSTGVQGKSLIDLVGIPSLQYYDEGDDDSESHHNETAFINIPHVHPGSDKYTAHQTELRRVIFLTWAMTLVVASLAMEVVDDALAGGPDLPDRKSLCAQILAKVKTLQSGNLDFQQLSGLLKTAKSDLKQKLRARDWGDDVRPLLNRQGRLRLNALGTAEGSPGSEERDKYLVRMWKQNIPDLHLTVAHEEASKATWMDMFRGLAQGQSLYLRVLADMPSTDGHVQRLIETIRPEMEKDGSWFEADDKREAALQACALWFQKKPTDPSAQRKAHLVAYPDEYGTTKDLQGRPVGVGSTGAVRIRWQKDDGDKVTVQIRVKVAVPEQGEGFFPRFLDFTAEGIDIVNAQGEPFRRETKVFASSEPATVPKDRLAGTEGGYLAVEMWQAVCAANNIDISDEQEPDVMVKDWSHVSKGQKGIAGNATKVDVAQYSSLKEGDAIYPLGVWLDDRFPEGGELHSIHKSRFLASTEDLQDFVQFLKSPAWRDHPYV